MPLLLLPSPRKSILFFRRLLNKFRTNLKIFRSVWWWCKPMKSEKSSIPQSTANLHELRITFHEHWHVIQHESCLFVVCRSQNLEHFYMFKCLNPITAETNRKKWMEIGIGVLTYIACHRQEGFLIFNMYTHKYIVVLAKRNVNGKRNVWFIGKCDLRQLAHHPICHPGLKALWRWWQTSQPCSTLQLLYN